MDTKTLSSQYYKTTCIHMHSFHITRHNMEASL